MKRNKILDSGQIERKLERTAIALVVDMCRATRCGLEASPLQSEATPNLVDEHVAIFISLEGGRIYMFIVAIGRLLASLHRLVWQWRWGLGWMHNERWVASPRE